MKIFIFFYLTLVSIGSLCMDESGQNAKQDQASSDLFAEARERMVRTQIAARHIRDKNVLSAMRRVPRHLFVPKSEQRAAYDDTPLPIGWGQTISQPYIVAYMTEQLHLTESDTVLEIGTGSGYQAAILAELAAQVYTIEIVTPLCEQASKTLAKLGYDNVQVRCGDGYEGWPEHAPFDAVIVTAAPPKVPQPLIDQLKVGGRMIVPVGRYYQELVLITKTGDGAISRRKLIPVRFVPMTGEIENKE